MVDPIRLTFVHGAVTIRSAQAADEGAITALHARCIGDAFAGKYFPPDEERAERQQSWTGPIGSPYPRHALLVAQHAGGVIGFVAVGSARDPDRDSATVGELRVVLVDAHERGSGVGFALIAAGERAMRESGLLAATLWAVPENAQAVRCYERCGWSADGTERLGDFDGREIRSVRYEKRLAL